MRLSHPLWYTLRSLKGNQRACVLTEPLWSIPYNWIMPFLSIYMAAIGLQDAQIGMITSAGLAMQFVWALFSGAIVDKYGRRKTMLIFGLICWSLPCMIWAAAQGYWYFLFAVFFNSMWRVTGNCFSCMIVEEGDSTQLINIYTILNLLGLFAGFLSPLIGLCIDRFTLVPVMRVIFIIAMVMMSVKFLLQYYMARETAIGIRRREECKEVSLFALSFGGWSVFLSALRQKRLMLYVTFMILMNCFNIVQTTFWPLFIKTSYGVSDSMISVFPVLRSATTILVYLFITSRIKMSSIRRPLLIGLASNGFGLIMLLLFRSLGGLAIAAVFLSATCEAFALAILNPLCESLLSVSIPEKERARVNSLIVAFILLISVPVGGIAGLLSNHDRAYPLLLNLGILFVEILLAWHMSRGSDDKKNLHIERIV